MKKNLLILVVFALVVCTGFYKIRKSKNYPIKLITLDPGHFHAALVQKLMYKDVDPVVHVYAPGGPDVQLHLDKIQAYNTRTDNPTNWKEEVYTGDDFLEKMLSGKKGNVVVIAGNNKKKTEYINKAIEGGFNVLADKPMVINKSNFELLKKSFAEAAKKNVLLYDIMTERFEITSILQGELSLLPQVFGQLEKGTPDNPAVVKESVHYYYKYVSGSVLTRAPWALDVTQQGEGIVDVATHLVDLVQWQCFPGQALDYTKDIHLTSARRWATDITARQFTTLTKLDTFPGYLKKELTNDSILKVYDNGEINYRLKGVNAKVTVKWEYKAPEGAGDMHYSMLRGTKANLVIRQGAEQNFEPALYIEPVNTSDASYATALINQIKSIQAKYPGVDLKKTASGWEVVIPAKYKEGHEAHFARVTENFLQYLKEGKLPAWEVPNMLAKYYTTTSALELATKDK